MVVPNSRGLVVSKRRVAGGTILEIQGNLDYEHSSLLTEEVRDLIRVGEIAILLDLAKVEFISSSGVAALVRVRKILEDRAGRILLFNLSRDVRTVFDLTRVSEYFEIAPDESGALEILRRGSVGVPPEDPAG